MDLDLGGILLRWMHILAVVALFGGTLFQRVALLPGMGNVDDESREKAITEMRRRWSRVVMIAILFLLVSGLINFILTIKLFKGAQVQLPPWYHALFGIKFILALAVFFFASALAGRTDGTKRFREQAGRWLTINLILMTIIVCLSGVMRSIHIAPNAEPTGEANVRTDAQAANPRGELL